MTPSRILGIESSCDETSAAIVFDGRTIGSNVVASQIPVHRRFGGVVPEIASRQHVLAIDNVVEQALTDAGVDLEEVEAVAVTYGPGLAGPLLVGISFAKGLALVRRLPLFAVNHVEAHILSVWLTASREPPSGPVLPMIALVVSGGHTLLARVDEPGRYRLLGQTLDDAAGEAFDKVGRVLGLPYPGGPSIELAADQAEGAACPSLPRAWLPGTHDFSFSGLKTAVVRLVREMEPSGGPPPKAVVPSLAKAFQDSICDVLSSKLAAAAADEAARSAAIVGGVANNQAVVASARERLDVDLYTPGTGLASDNAAMIAGAAFLNPRPAGYDLEPSPSLSLEVAST